MLELFLSALEDQLGLIVDPPIAPIARMNIISLEITRLTRVVEHRDEAVGEGAEESPKTLRTED